MRCTQEIGLTHAAQAFIKENIKITPTKTCPTCKHVKGGEPVQSIYDDSGSSGMFDDGPSLFIFELKDGRKVREVVQCAPWSSGPMIFLCLEDEEGNRMFEWKQDKTIEGEVNPIAGTYWV